MNSKHKGTQEQVNRTDTSLGEMESTRKKIKVKYFRKKYIFYFRQFHVKKTKQTSIKWSIPIFNKFIVGLHVLDTVPCAGT